MSLRCTLLCKAKMAMFSARGQCGLSTAFVYECPVSWPRRGHIPRREVVELFKDCRHDERPTYMPTVTYHLQGFTTCDLSRPCPGPGYRADPSRWIRGRSRWEHHAHTSLLDPSGTKRFTSRPNNVQARHAARFVALACASLDLGPGLCLRSTSTRTMCGETRWRRRRLPVLVGRAARKFGDE